MTRRIIADRAVEVIDGRTVRLFSEGRLVSTQTVGEDLWSLLRAWLAFRDAA